MRTTPARLRVYDYLGDALQPVWDELRVTWDGTGGEFLPDRVLKGQMEFDQRDESDDVVAYLSPQEVRTIDDRLPLIAVTAAISQPWEATEHIDALTEEFRGTHQIQVYCWMVTDSWLDIANAIEAFAGSVAYTLALDHSLGDAEGGTRLVPDSLSISYSEVNPHGGEGALAGASVSFLLTSEDVVSVLSAGTVPRVETTEATAHPAL